jgi:hypothetical protein
VSNIPTQVFTDQGWQPRDAGSSSALVVGASSVVWRPGGVTNGNVYATWAEVVAAVATLQGEVTIAVDDAIAPAVIPAGAWNLRPAGVSGPVIFVNGNSTTFGAFVTIDNAIVTIHGLTGLDAVQVENKSLVDVIVGTTLDQFFFFMRGATLFQSALAGGAAFIKITSGTSFVIMDDQSIVSTLDAGSGALQTVAPGFLFLQVNDSSSFQNDMLIAAVLTAQVNCTGPDQDGGFPSYATQTGAPLINPIGLVQKGSDSIVLGTGKSAAITAFIGPNTRIECTQRSPSGDGGVNPTVRYAGLVADRVTGNPGTFKISALTNVGGGDANLADVSSVDWVVYN